MDTGLDNLTQLKQGDERAWHDLIALHQNRILNYLYRLEGHYDEALDLTQEVFFRAWKGIGTFREGEPFLPWLYQIARNTQIEKHRRKVHPQFSLDEANDETGFELPSHYQSAVLKAEQHHSAEKVQQALQSLAHDYREALVLRFVEDLPYEDIAKIQNVALGTAKSRVFRAKEMLAHALQGLA